MEEKVCSRQVIDSVYFHVGNSGVTFEVYDEGHGATVEISSSAFGNLVTSAKYHISAKELKVLGDMFTEASKEKFSKTYCESAKYDERDNTEERKKIREEKKGRKNNK